MAICPRFKSLEIAEGCEWQPVAIGPQQGKVRVRVVADRSRGDWAPIGASQLRLPCSLHDMAVGEQKTVRRNDDAEPIPATRPEI